MKRRRPRRTAEAAALIVRAQAERPQLQEQEARPVEKTGPVHDSVGSDQISHWIHFLADRCKVQRRWGSR